MELNIERIARNRVGDYLISTVELNGVYETAIRRGHNPYIVVQHYNSKTAAKKGHARWADYCKNSPEYVYDTNNKKQPFVGGELCGM